MPGEYRVRAEHPVWDLQGPVDGIPVHLGWESVVLESTYTVQGLHQRRYSSMHHGYHV